MRRQKVIIIGDSHTTAIAEAVRLREETGAHARSPLDFFASRLSKMKPNGATIPGLSEDEASKLLKRAKPDDVLVAVIGGNQYNTLGLLEAPQPFDLVDPETRAAPESVNARIVPLAQMTAAFDDFVGGIRPPLQKYKGQFPGLILYLNPPPPKGDNAYIKKNAEGYFRTDGKVRVNVSPPGMRRRLWLVQSQALARLCEANGVTFLDAPADSISADGFLVREAYGADATHANAFYGELVLQQLERLLTGQDAA